MSRTTLFCLFFFLCFVNLGCEKEAPDTAPSDSVSQAASAAKPVQAPAKLQADKAADSKAVDAPKVLPPSVAGAKKGFEKKSFRPGDQPDSMGVTGKVVDGMRWSDENGDNFLLFSEKSTTRPAGPEDDTPDEPVVSKFIYATHYVKPHPDIDPIKKRTVKDRQKDCQWDLTAEFIGASIGLSDLDADGLAEVTFAYKLNCTSDVSPGTLKLLVLEDGEKYIIRGQTRVDLGDGSQGGEYKVDPSFDKAPAGFVDHAKKVWDGVASK